MTTLEKKRLSKPHQPQSYFTDKHAERVHSRMDLTLLASPTTLALLLLLALTTYKLIVYPLFLHPLRHIPSAHWSIPLFGDLWILYQRWSCRNNAVTYAAHLAHGEVVRLGYNELSINCVDNGIKTIYGQGWEKHAWYPQQFASFGVSSMFVTLGHVPHSQKKRTMANVYSKSYLAASPQVAANSKTLLTQRILPAIQAFAESGQVVDVHDFDNAMTMDFMSAFQFGIHHGTNFVQNEAERAHILHHYHGRRPYEFYSSELPWIKPLCRAVGIHLIPQQFDASNDILEDWLRNMGEGADRVMHEDGLEVGAEPIVYRQFKQGLYNIRNKNPDAGKAVEGALILPTAADATHDKTQLEVHSEMLDHLGAGHETSAMALTYLFWELSKNTYLQSLLRKEIRTLSPRIVWPPPDNDTSSFTLPSPKDIDALPLLNAILMETLRLHAPIPGIQPRVSPHPAPPGGHTLGPYTNIPSGVRVSSMPYTLHRNPVVFPNPETFQPRRWLDSSPAQLKEMHRWFWAFGSGGRMCIGSNLANQEMKLLVCAILGNWEVSVPQGGDEGIEEIDAYTVRPRSNKLMVVFKAVK